MNNCDTSNVQEAYKDLCDNKTKTNWLLLKFTDTKPSVLEVANRGNEGIEEMKECLKEDEAAFGFLRMAMSNDEYSERTKFVLISWIGDKVGIMRRARLGIQKADVTSALGYFSIEIPASRLDEIDEADILTRLRKAGGANYDRQTSEY
ncbi:hypothetical protein LPJ63_003716 [Coemansia sp. RSA 2711]|nr:hypothetical protein LPJ63_003716 [Coemansia sp. RSA 2711]